MSAKVVNGYRYNYHEVTNPRSSVVGYITRTDVSRKRRRYRTFRRSVMRLLNWLDYGVFPVLTCALATIFSKKNARRMGHLLTTVSLLCVSGFFTLCICGGLLYAVNPEAGEALAQLLLSLGF